jgi:hypothetical protein
VDSQLVSSPSGETAHTLVLIGLVLQGIEVGVILFIGFVLIIPPGVGAVVFGLALVGVIWLLLVYTFSYRRTNEGDYEGARTPTLVFGILSIVGLGIVSGILYLVAYWKLGDAINETTDTTPPWAAPIPALTRKFCPSCGRASPPSSRFCQVCGAQFV